MSAQAAIPFDVALARVVEGVGRLGLERCATFEADGRVLAEDLRAPRPMPAFDYSAMDGYALAHASVEGGPHGLPLAGVSAAGGVPEPLAAGHACRIYTGAPLPPGADTVIMQEDVRVEGGTLRFERGLAPGENVRRRGEDLQQGVVALGAGLRLTPGRAALAASLDHATLLVARRPVVTILCSGDELRSPGEPGSPFSIVESNGFFVRAVARRLGAEVRLGPFVRDDRDATERALVDALAGCDLLVTIGGVSVGDRDFVRPALESAGVSIDFYKVAMKPGKPITVGRRGATRVLGLPGNPASASLTFLLFGVPLLRAMSGELGEPLPRVLLPIRGSLRRKPGRTEFARARLIHDAGAEIAELLPNQASGAVTSFAQAEALVEIAAERAEVATGDTLPVLRLSSLFAG